MTRAAARTGRVAHRPGRGRDLADLAGDFGYTLPQLRPATARAEKEKLFPGVERRRGRFARYTGWTAVPAPLVPYRMTSDQTPGLWPFIAATGLPPTGAPIGIDHLSHGAFYADPIGWVLNPAIAVTNPNVIVFGKPGQGKSATVKVFCLRLRPFGYRILILGDAKDEYEKLCRFLGVEPIIFGPGHPARINVLDPGPLRHGWDQLTAEQQVTRTKTMFGLWLKLLAGMVGSQKIGERPVPFGPNEHNVLSAILTEQTGAGRGTSELAETTIPRVHAALDEPSPELIRACRYPDRQAFFDGTELLRNSLGTLVKGHLAGLFDQPTNINIDWRAPIQSLSLSRIDPLGDEAVGIALMCLNTWGTAMRMIAEPGDRRIVVRDEAWKQMRLGLEPVKALDASLRLSRGSETTGADVQIISAHKPSDMLSVGSADSQATAIAKDLIHLCDTKILLGQDQKVGDELQELLGLQDKAANLVTGWAMQAAGRALWQVGPRSFKVATTRTRLEEQLTWTNDALTRSR